MSLIIRRTNPLLFEYANGNYSVKLYSDGTKVRETEGSQFLPLFPESIDLKITNKCDKNCSFCHEQSHIGGSHADLRGLEFLKTLPVGMEVAIGGGNPLEHPDLEWFLRILKENGQVASMTVNEEHLTSSVEALEYVIWLMKERLINGLGISFVSVAGIKGLEERFRAEGLNRRIVVHIIAGLCSLSDFVDLGTHGEKRLSLLILGYKQFGRGISVYAVNRRRIDAEIRLLGDMITSSSKYFRSISFDNLAIEQLGMQSRVSSKVWCNSYMGGEGEFTMYVDAVKEQFAVSSMSSERWGLRLDIRDMFRDVRDYVAERGLG